MRRGNEARAVLVTGASSGIGRHLAERLAGLDIAVYATARTEAAIAALDAIPGVTGLPLDVRDEEQVRAAAARVAAGGLPLVGLVNNAGLGGLGPVATWTDEEIQEIFDVNVFGPIRVSRACLPLLLPAQGRIVNIGSQGGSIAMRYFGPYTMTKHALEAFTVALDDELAPYGVRVSIVQPGGVRSAIGANAHEGNLGRFRRAVPPFDEEARAVLAAWTAPPDPEAEARAAEEPESAANRKPSDPEIVAVAVLDALFAETPRPRYLVGTRWEGERVLRMLVERLLDANDCPSIGDPVESLVARLRSAADERMGRERTP